MYGPLTLNIRTWLQVIKSLKRHNINSLCLCLKQEQMCKLYIPSMFQTSDIEILSKTFKLNIHLTKSPKLDHIY